MNWSFNDYSKNNKIFKFEFNYFWLITFLSISNVNGSSFTFRSLINEAFKNSLIELKSQKYKLEATKHSLQEAYSSKKTGLIQFLLHITHPISRVMGQVRM